MQLSKRKVVIALAAIILLFSATAVGQEARVGPDFVTVLQNAAKMAEHGSWVCQPKTEKYELSETGRTEIFGIDEDTEAVKELSLELLFRPGRFQTKLGLELDNFLAVDFKPQDEKTPYRPLPDESGITHKKGIASRLLSRLVGTAIVDKKTGAFRETHADLLGEDIGYGLMSALGKVDDVHFDYEQVESKYGWAPQYLRVRIKYRKLAVSHHREYITHFNCAPKKGVPPTAEDAR